MKKYKFRYEVLILKPNGSYEQFLMNSMREVKDFLESELVYVGGRPVRVIDNKTGVEKMAVFKVEFVGAESPLF